MKTIRLVLVFFSLIVIMSSGAWANYAHTGSPLDTTAETTVISDGANNQVYYHDLNLNPRNTVTSETFTLKASSEYGISHGFNELDTVNDLLVTTRGFGNVWPQSIVNEGNAPISFNITYEAFNLGGASGWIEQFYLATNEASVGSGTSFTLAEDEWVSFEVKVLSSFEASRSPDGSSGGYLFFINFPTSYPFSGTDINHWAWGYRAPNGLYYGGNTSFEVRYDIVTIETAVLEMTRSATVDSPDSYSGGRHDPVPGSLYTILLTLTNEGSAGTGFDSTGIVVIDKVPDNMTAYKIDVQEPEPLVNVTSGTGVNGSVANWDVYYTTTGEAYLDRSWGGAGWNVFGIGDMGAEYTLPSDATFVKWESRNNAMAPTEFEVFQWSCTIK